MNRTIVIGAGVSGLALSHRLLSLKPDLDLTVLEASSRAGGLILSQRKEGFLYECGPETVIDDGSGLNGLVDELGLAARSQLADPVVKNRYIVHKGKLAALPGGPGSAIRTPLLTIGEKLRILGEPFRKRGTDEEESFGSFIARRFGPAVLERLAEPFASGIYAGVPERMEMASCFPKIWKAEREHGSVIRGMGKMAKARRKAGEERRKMATISFDEGNRVLVEAMAESLGDRLRLDTPVQSIHPLPQGGFRVELVQGEALECDTLVVAAPAPKAKTLFAEDFPGISQELDSIVFLNLVSIHLALDKKDVPDDLRGFGFLIPRQESRSPVLGCLYSSQIFAGRAAPDQMLFRLLLGGARNPDFDPTDLPSHVEAALSTFATLTGIQTQPRLLHHQVWPQALPLYEPGHQARLARLAALTQAHEGLHLTGVSYGGSSVPRCIENARALAERIAQAQPR